MTDLETKIRQILDAFKAEDGSSLPVDPKQLAAFLQEALQKEFGGKPAFIKPGDHISEIYAKMQYLESIAELLPASLFAKDRNRRYIYVNSNFVKSTGFKSENDILGKTSEEIFSGKRRGTARVEDNAVLSEGAKILNNEHLDRAPGIEDQWVSVSKVPVRDHSGNIIGMVGMLRDINDRKLAETQLKETMDELASKNRMMEKDLQLAHGIQQSLLPRISDNSRYPGLHVAFNIRQHDGVGGDFLYFEAQTKTKTVALICDVMGHGVRAALVVSLIRGLVLDVCHYYDNPGDFLSKLNRSYCDALRFHEDLIFVTALCLDFDSKTRLCRYASAGHPMPLLFLPDRNEVERLVRPPSEEEAAIGLIETSRYEFKERPLRPGDAALLYTDGIIEMLDANELELGRELLIQAFKEVANLDANDVVEKVIEAMVQHGAGPPDDDLTLAFLRVL